MINLEKYSAEALQLMFSMAVSTEDFDFAIVLRDELQMMGWDLEEEPASLRNYEAGKLREITQLSLVEWSQDVLVLPRAR